MVSIIDVTLLQKLGVVFPFLFIFAVSFGVLTLAGLFKDNKLVQALIAVALAFIGSLSPIVVRTINLMAPWFVILIIFMVLLLIAIMTLGPTREDIASLIRSGKHEYIIWWVVFFVVLITIFSLWTAVSEVGKSRAITEPGTAVYSTEEMGSTYQLLVNPKILGIMFLILIAVVTLHYMTKE